jgi:hypothetical protein
MPPTHLRDLAIPMVRVESVRGVGCLVALFSSKSKKKIHTAEGLTCVNLIHLHW